MLKRIVLASPRGFCAGVDRAIEIVRLALSAYGAPVYVYHEIVHNPYVVAELRTKGAIFVNDLSEVPAGARAIYSAHGVSPAVRTEADGRSLQVIDATCPLVTKVHTEAQRFAKGGFHILLVGHKGHDEVVGTMGEAPEQTTLVGNVAEAETVQVPDGARVALLTQTTLSVDDATAIVQTLRKRFPELQFPREEDICYATQNRQFAVKKLTEEADLILVLGGSNSSNSQRLQEVAEQYGAPAHLVNNVSEVKAEWLVGVETVGLTSGASTPEFLVQEAVSHFQALGAAEITLVETAKERAQFALPKELSRA